jgi:hypothetical protein
MMRRLTRYIFLSVVLIGGLLPDVAGTRAFAQEMPVPCDLQCSLFKKILAFDRRNNRARKSQFVIAILYQSGFRSSSTTEEAFSTAVENSRSSVIDGKAVRSVSIDLDDSESLFETLVADSVDAVYVAPLRSFPLDSIIAVSRALRVLTMTGVPDYCEKGIATAIGVHANRPQIIINVPALKDAGAEINAQVLRVAKVIQ